MRRGLPAATTCQYKAQRTSAKDLGVLSPDRSGPERAPMEYKDKQGTSQSSAGGTPGHGGGQARALRPATFGGQHLLHLGQFTHANKGFEITFI